MPLSSMLFIYSTSNSKMKSFWNQNWKVTISYHPDFIIPGEKPSSNLFLIIHMKMFSPFSLEAVKICLASELLYSLSITAWQMTTNFVAWNNAQVLVHSSVGTDICHGIELVLCPGHRKVAIAVPAWPSSRLDALWKNIFQTDSRNLVPCSCRSISLLVVSWGFFDIWHLPS